MSSVNFWSCNTEIELENFLVGVENGSIYEQQLFIFKAPPNSLYFRAELAELTLPYFRWMSDRRRKLFPMLSYNVLKVFCGDHQAAVSFVTDTLSELTIGNDEKRRVAEEIIMNPSLCQNVSKVFDLYYLLGSVSVSDKLVSFYRNDGRF